MVKDEGFLAPVTLLVDEDVWLSFVRRVDEQRMTPDLAVELLMRGAADATS